jgi:DnaJ-class molecular chaperone
MTVLCRFRVAEYPEGLAFEIYEGRKGNVIATVTASDTNDLANARDTAKQIAAIMNIHMVTPERDCPECEGTGIAEHGPCEYCLGTGTVEPGGF